MKKNKQQSYSNMVGSNKKVSDNMKSTNKNNNSKVNFGLTDTDGSSEVNKETNSNITDCK